MYTRIFVDYKTVAKLFDLNLILTFYINTIYLTPNSRFIFVLGGR